MNQNIQVSKVNFRYLGSALNVFYIGRKYLASQGELKGSPLGNKYVIGKDGSREEVIEKYRKWLWKEVKKGMKGENNEPWNELMKLLDCYKHSGKITLMCWCKPKACHGDVIKSCLEWLIREGY